MNAERMRNMYHKLVANIDLSSIEARFVTFAMDRSGRRVEREEYAAMTPKDRRDNLSQVGVNIGALDKEVNERLRDVFDAYEDAIVLEKNNDR